MRALQNSYVLAILCGSLFLPLPRAHAEPPKESPVIDATEEPGQSSHEDTTTTDAPVPVAPGATPAPSTNAIIERTLAPKQPQESEDLSDRYGKTHGVAGPLTFGPSLTLLGLTRPFAVGLESKYLDIWGLAGFYGFLPEITVSNVKVKYSSWDARFRYYLFRGSFFVGAAVGGQNIKATKSTTISGVPVTANLTMDSMFVTPHVGWHWIWKSGFFMGIDLGVQLSVSRTTSVSSDAAAPIQALQQYQDLSNDVTSNAEKLGKKPLPMLTLLKVGFLF